MNRSPRSFRCLIAVAAISLVAGCATGAKRDLYADVEIGTRFAYEAVSDLARQELKSRDACDQVALLTAQGSLVSEGLTKTCKPVGTFITKDRAAGAHSTLQAVTTVSRLAADTTAGCIEPGDAQGKTALQKLGLAGCVTSDQALIAALAAVRLLRQNLEE